MTDFYTKQQVDLMMAQIGERINNSRIGHFPLAGQYLCDPNEVNGWGVLGVYDNSNTQDLGNVGVNNLSRTTGALLFPYDIQLLRFKVDHYNSNNVVEPWGWVLGSQAKTGGTNTVTTKFILDESTNRAGINNGAGLRNYGNTVNQHTDIDLSQSANSVVPAGEGVFLAVGAPTANPTNHYVRILAGYLSYKILGV